MIRFKASILFVLLVCIFIPGQGWSAIGSCQCEIRAGGIQLKEEEVEGARVCYRRICHDRNLCAPSYGSNWGYPDGTMEEIDPTTGEPTPSSIMVLIFKFNGTYSPWESVPCPETKNDKGE